MPKTPPKAPAFLALAALLGPILAGQVLDDTKADEGVVYRAYPDLGGVWSICSGSTHGVKPGEVDTDEQCDARTSADLLTAAKIVLACAPDLKGHHQQLRAMIRFQNNTGRFCTSSAAAPMREGRFRAGCDAILAYRGIVTAKPMKGKSVVSVRKLKSGKFYNVIRGLMNRRAKEHGICVSDL